MGMAVSPLSQAPDPKKYLKRLIYLSFIRPLLTEGEYSTLKSPPSSGHLSLDASGSISRFGIADVTVVYHCNAPDTCCQTA